ncbi:MAG: hypothetical protein CL885_04490 [Dehalococcoidia bacterium]|nr:hypothetical protein [Dehalococcoidia bacterium]
MSGYKLEYVTRRPDLWKDSDPVRPELGVDFKTSTGRGVFGLQGAHGDWKAFMCYARTNKIPTNVEELDKFTDKEGSIIIPYTVWSHEKGAGRVIINEVLEMARSFDVGIERVVTLSPLTEMAERFHMRNGAMKLQSNKTTVNFEYEVYPSKMCSSCGCDPCDCDWGIC